MIAKERFINKRRNRDNIISNPEKDRIFIKGAKANNLKDISLSLPKNRLVVVTGVSGSGKSSLTIDTLYAEGQRRYVESLSSYARQFLMRMKKPEVDYIKGICPAIAIEQKVSTRNSRSTVGSLTEIYDYLRLLYARIGQTFSPISGERVRKHEVTDVVNFIHDFEEGTKIQLFGRINHQKYSSPEQAFQLLLQKGYTRVLHQDKLTRVEDLLETERKKTKKKQFVDYSSTPYINVLIDRFAVSHSEEENKKRIADSVQTAFLESEGECLVDVVGKEQKAFNNRFELDGITFEEPTPHLFNFNNPYGACPKCEGFGKVMGIDEDKVIPNKSLSVYEDAVACWRGDKSSKFKKKLIAVAEDIDFPIHRAYKDLTDKQRALLWSGNRQFKGIDSYFAALEEKMYKIQNRVMLARYRGRTRCMDCAGKRLRKEATYIQVGGKNITELVDIPVVNLKTFFDTIVLSEHDNTIAKRLILDFMLQVGLGYLTIGRLSSTLSGGETQRINLTRTLGSNLTSSMYILDEPSIGLHPRDTARLVNVLKTLRDLGNTVVVVEHEEEVIKNCDYLVDIGPLAGVHGGEVVFAGPYKDIYKDANDSLTAKYMSGRMEIPTPKLRRKTVNFIRIKGANQHNLKDIDVNFPMNCLVTVTGVSGSGKTSLVKQILYPALKKHLGEALPQKIGDLRSLEGDLSLITQVEMINQSPIGRSSRSNPVTYVKAYDAIRKLFADKQLSRIRGFKPKHFSFNVEGGRCETCKGEGETVVEMQFLADVRLICEECEGNRFKQEVMDVRYREKSIFDVLNMSIDEALEFFVNEKDIVKKIKPLQDVGLGYVKLGQSSSTLSGGEAQRVKLASFIGRERKGEHIVFIFDEPTTGLHFHDIGKLMDALNALVENGHTVIVVEHNMEVIKSSDWVVDLGPEGGTPGGHLVFEGTPEDLAKFEGSYTGAFLKEKV